MKTNRFLRVFFILAVLIAALTLLFSACSRSKDKEIPVPTNLKISSDGILTWDAVPGTLTYDVKVDDAVYSTQETRYALIVGDNEFHSVTVRANTYDGTGEYATALSYKKRTSTAVLPQLSAPVISMTSNRLLWSTVLNNNGYRIYMGDTALPDVPKNTTYYDLTFPGDGTYYIRMQTLGDEVTYATSKISNAYAVTVKGGKAPLQKLAKTEFTFDADSKSLVWSNRYSADRVSYEIYTEGSDTPLVTIPADAAKTQLSYKPELTGARVSYKMRLISNNGLYNPSDFNTAITFPIADAAPADLTLTADSDLGAYLFSWREATYRDGYVLIVDEVEYDAGTSLSLALPEGLAAGRHIARVRTKGLGIHYADSLLSEGLAFYVGEKGTVTTPLAVPHGLTLSLDEDVLSVSIKAAVDHATKYRFRFVGASGENQLVSEFASFDLTEGRIGGRRTTDEERAVIARILGDLAGGVNVTVTALSADPLYVESPRSAEVRFRSGEETVYFGAPTDLTFDGKTFLWSSASDELQYEIWADGVTYDATDEITFTQGLHTCRIRVKGENTLWSEELLFRTPFEAEAPTALSIAAGVLSFVGSENATGYRLCVNGEALSTVYPTDDRIVLGNYLQEDGEYVLELIAIAGDAFVDSAPSRQILYVKDDAAYGTQNKPYVPASAEELWTTMREHPQAYYRLVAGAVYDFSNCDLSGGSFTFGGQLMGGGATLKGLTIASPLFFSIEGATIRDLRIEIVADSFDYDRNGLFAKKIADSAFSGVTFLFTVKERYVPEAAFGCLAYEATGLTMRDSNVTLDVAFTGLSNASFGAIAYKLNGSLISLKLAGAASVSGRDIQCGGLCVQGTVGTTGLDSALALTLNATGTLTAAGCGPSATVTGSSFSTRSEVAANGAYVTYYGIAKEGVTMTGGRLGGKVSAQGAQIALYGVAESEVISLSGVTVATDLKGKATDLLSVAGIAKEISAESVTTGSAFEGQIDCNAPQTEAAGFALTMLGDHAIRYAGDITVTGRTATVAAASLETETLTLENDGSFRLNKVTTAEVGGAAISASGPVTLTGGVRITANECGEVLFGGAVLGGDQEVCIEDYTIEGSIEADRICFGGVTYDGGLVKLSITDVTVDLSLSGEDILAAGAICSDAGLTVTGPATLSSSISATGKGEIGGFGLQLGAQALDDLSISGSLTLIGEGSLYGVSKEAGAVKRITSSVSLRGEGQVMLCGLFDSLVSAEDLTLSNTAVTILSDAATYWGLVRAVGNGAITGATVTGVTFDAEPQSDAGSGLTVYGLTESVKTLEGGQTSDLTYTIGGYDTLTFAGAAGRVTERARSSSMNYSLTSAAKSATVGGAFLSAKGNIALDLGTVEAPALFALGGDVDFGGLVRAPAEDLTLTTSRIYLDLRLDLAEGAESKAGGIFSEVGSGRQVTITDYETSVSLTRKGKGSLSFGGATATLSGKLDGAKARVSVSGATASDRVGGLVSTLTASGTLSSGAALGSISSAGPVGGLVCDASYARIEKGASAVSISTSDKAGGVACFVTSCIVKSVYSISRLVNKGAGLFWEGENVSLTGGYFAGASNEYALAAKAVNCAASSFALDVTSIGVPETSVVGEGSISYLPRSLGYGYTGSDLGDDFVADGRRYPYLRSVGSIGERVIASTRELSRIAISAPLDLYSVLPRFYDAEIPVITWVDEGGKLSVENGVATVTDNGSGTLYGVLSGGVKVYSVYYTASGYVPISGEGTESSPYLISDMKYLKYVKDYAKSFPTAYFRLDFEEETVGNAGFETLFTEGEPFRGHFDFDGVLFSSPEIAEEGIFGYLNGATVTGLRLAGDLDGVILAVHAESATVEEISIEDAIVAGDFTLISDARYSTIRNVTFVGSSSAPIDLTLAENMLFGTLQGVSVSLSVNASGSVAASVLGTSRQVTISEVQALWRISISGSLTLALARADIGSVFTECMSLTEASVIAPEDCSVAGLSLSSSGTTYQKSAVLLRSGKLSASPLIGEGTASYSGVVLLSDVEVSATAGVTVATVTAFKTLAGEIEGFVSGDLPTPLGYAFFGETTETGFSIREVEVALTEKTPLVDLTTVFGEKPFATMVGYSFSGECAEVAGDALRPRKDGVGTLTYTNVYGIERYLTVRVEGFDGFASGDGTEEDPYLIADFEDFRRMLASADDDAYYLLTQDLSGEITESAVFRGELTSSHRTVTIDLAADTLFSDAYGVIDGVNFVIKKTAFEAPNESGLFAAYTSGMTLADAEITIVCPTITLESGATFGLLIGKAESNTVLQNLTISVGTVAIEAADATVGIVAGRADGSVLRSVTVSGDMTVVGSGEILLGSVGYMTASSSTYSEVDPLSGPEVVRYYGDGITLDDLLMTATAPKLTVGGAAGRSNVKIGGVRGSVSVILSSGEVTVGGAIGETELGGELTDVILSASIFSSTEISSGAVGGLVGIANADITGSTVTAVIDVTARSELYAGGAVGIAYYDLSDLNVNAEIDAHSSADPVLIAVMLDDPDDYAILVAAGGAAGNLSGDANHVAVNVTLVRATTDYAGDALGAIAGGLAGRAFYLTNVEIKGAGQIAASGGNSVAAGLVAYLAGGAECAVISGVSLSASAVCGAVGVASVRDESEVSAIYVTLSDLSEESPALVGVLTEDSTVADCHYLSGKAIGTGDLGSVTDSVKHGSASDFLLASLYSSLDGEEWHIAGGEIPSLE